MVGSVGFVNPPDGGEFTEEYLQRLTGQPNLEDVTTVTCQNCRVFTLVGLRVTPNLVELDVSGNELRNLMGIEALVRLKKLVVSRNKIVRLGDLSALVSLEHLLCQGNLLENLDEVAGLASLPRFKSLYLRNNDLSQPNPMCSHPAYRNAILRMLPNLRNLDGERLRNSGVGVSGYDGEGDMEDVGVPIYSKMSRMHLAELEANKREFDNEHRVRAKSARALNKARPTSARDASVRWLDVDGAKDELKAIYAPGEETERVLLSKEISECRALAKAAQATVREVLHGP